MRKMKHHRLTRSFHGIRPAAEQRRNVATVELRWERHFHTRPTAKGREKIIANHTLMTPRVRRDAGPANDQGYTNAPLPYIALAAIQRASIRSAIIRHVDDDGVLRQPHRIQLRQQLTHSAVKVFRDGRTANFLVISA